MSDRQPTDRPEEARTVNGWWTGNIDEGISDLWTDDPEETGPGTGFGAWTKSRTFWTRLEPDTRAPEFDTMGAEVHDPAWMLTRQWQFGEFAGEDAGSPVLANMHYQREHLGRIRLGPDPEDTTRDYEGRPIEAMVEREPMTTADDASPGLRTRVEAGQAFLRALEDADYTKDGTPYTAEDFVDEESGDGEEFLVSDPDEPMDADARRFASLSAGRALDGHEIYGRLVDETNIEEKSEWRMVSWPSSEESLPIPQGKSLTDPDGDDLKKALKHFVDHYEGLFDEPASEDSFPWQEQRLEYGFEVSTGDQDNETVLEAPEYPGGHLDWYSFSVADGDSLGAPDQGSGGEELVDSGTDEAVLSRAEFKGMPVPRWWEFENGEVSLDHLPAGPDELTKALVTDYVFAYGNNWFVLPLDAPIGSLTHIPESVDGEPGFTVTDNFGKETTIEPVTGEAEHWNMYMHEAVSSADAERPGLFLPPTLDESVTSEPRERVYFARDQMANMAFAVEERVEGPTGDPRERAEFDRPDLAIDRIGTGTGVDKERIVLRNVGDAPLDITGWAVEVNARSSPTVSGDPKLRTLHTFTQRDGEPVVVGSDETITLYTGQKPAGDVVEANEAYAGESSRVWTDTKTYGQVTIRREESYGTVEERFVTRKLVTTPDEAMPDYTLATSVPDHWYPLKPKRPKTGSTTDLTDARTYRLALSLLLDADAMDVPLRRIPTPEGRLLSGADLELYEEEVPRSGREVERYYQLARWTDGSTWVWSSREASTGKGEAASRLRFDLLDDPDADTASEKQ